jgi:hypothetical protein
MDVFEHHDGVGAGWNRSTGHDLPGSAFGKRPGWSVAGTGGSNQIERSMRGGFGGAAGESVAGGAGERRLIAIGAERLGEHTACG